MKRLTALLLIFSLAYTEPAHAGNMAAKNPTVSGKVKDKKTGEELIGVTIFIKEMNTGTTTNTYGFYSLSLPAATYHLSFSYIGYQTEERTVVLKGPVTLNVELETRQVALKEVVVTGTRPSDNVSAPEMSVVKMDIRTIRQIPALMGEVDILKAIQLLPGVQTTSEGATGFSVRGGSPDQNLILLDEATVYNASHLMGFFSVFNNDAIRDVKLYKGDIPPASGGRLSSLLDVRMKEGNARETAVTGGIGTISSRLTVESPIRKDKASFIVSGRRTYADLFLKLANDEDLRDNRLYFYDVNAKVNVTLNAKDRLFFSAYLGRDIFKNPDFRMGWGNQTLTVRWNHLFSSQLFSNFTLIRSRFDYSLGIPEGQADSFRWTSLLDDYAIKGDFGYYPNPRNTFRFGISGKYHRFQPGSAVGLGESSFFNEYKLPSANNLDYAIYAGNEQQISPRFTAKYGLRLTMFQNIGSGTQYRFDEEYNTLDSTVYPKWKIFNTYTGWEPRLAFTYRIDSMSSVKASYSRTVQYIHLASNSASGNPLDVWFPSSPNVRPQEGEQYSAGYFRNFFNNRVETSLELYYKKNFNTIDFKDHAELLLNPELEGELRTGTSTAYGLECYIRFEQNGFSGWVSYTLSSALRKIEGINDSKEYRSPYDKPHNIAIVMNLAVNRRVSLGTSWVFASGAPVTFPTGRAIIGNKIVPVYSDRNAYRMPAYHRLDLSLTLKGKQKPDRKFLGEWNFSVYNAYARKNAWVINFEQDPDDQNIVFAEKTYLFSIIPSVTYNFRF